MNKMIQAIAVVVAIGLSAMYFTTAKPSVEASENRDGIDNMVFVIFKRVQNIEQQQKIKVPDDLKLSVNGVREK